MRIKDIKAIEVLDSRGNPTIRSFVYLSDGSIGVSSVPSGASKGKFEAVEKRDGTKRYNGLGVLDAVNLINTTIKDILVGSNSLDQFKIDKSLIGSDGTEDKHNFGANSILSISLAVLRASSIHLKIPLYKRINDLYYQLTGVEEELKLPIPMLNILNGGAHANNNLSFQEFMIVPTGINEYPEKIRAASEIYHALKGILIKKGENIGLGDEGGFAPNISSPKQILSLICEAVEMAGYKNESQIQFAIDAAATEFFKDGKYFITSDDGIYKQEMDYKELTEVYLNLAKEFPIYSIEDPMAEEDYEGWSYLKEKFDKLHKSIIIGDDLTVTNVARLKDDEKYIDGAITKPNQIGTFYETINFITALKQNNKKIIISHRSGETSDSTIMDLAVGINSGLIKSGAPARAERTSKYNRGIEIYHELN